MKKDDAGVFGFRVVDPNESKSFAATEIARTNAIRQIAICRLLSI